MPEAKRRIAVLIDADNSPAAKIELIMTEVASFGEANVRRAYGNWKSAELQGWEAVLHEYAIQPMQQFAYSRGKNASDMAMVVDAMDLLHTGSLDGFALISSDADFTPLVMRIRAGGLKVYGFGQDKTPLPFVNGCSQFVYIEALGDSGDDDGAEHNPRQDQASLRQDTRLLRMLRAAIEAARGDDEWANLSAVGSQVANQASFDPRNYGYPKLSDLIEAIGLFELKRADNALLVRSAPRKTTAAKTSKSNSQKSEQKPSQTSGQKSVPKSHQ